MRCNEFHRQMADWVRDRLAAEMGERMTLHASDCRSCAEEAALERSLRQSFAQVAPISRTPDLWARIENRVEATTQPRFAFSFQRMFAMGGALAAGAFLAIMTMRGPVVSPVPGTPRTDHEFATVQKLSEIRMVSDPVDPEVETPNSAEAAHMLLVGGPGR